MTFLLDRTPDTEPERPLMTTPPRIPAVPGTTNVPWWTGIPGLDPDVRPVDWQTAARCAAMACAAQVAGLDAGRGSLFRAAPVTRWLRWLYEAGDDTECRMRILALRLVCERATGVAAEDILRLAQEIYAATAVR